MREMNSSDAALRGLIIAMLAIIPVGCTKPAGPDFASGKPGPAVGIKPVSATGGEVQAQANLVFFDSDAFDVNLAQAMQDRAEEVHVVFAGPTSLNSFPARINTWLAEVKHSDGSVTAVDPKAEAQQTRGLLGVGIVFDLIDLIAGIQTRREMADRLAQSHAYDARILYDATTGLAHEVVFIRRGLAAPAATPATAPAPIAPAGGGAT